jgi:hypothetical protein
VYATLTTQRASAVFLAAATLDPQRSWLGSNADARRRVATGTPEPATAVIRHRRDCRDDVRDLFASSNDCHYISVIPTKSADRAVRALIVMYQAALFSWFF